MILNLRAKQAEPRCASTKTRRTNPQLV
jgi:hypothetical protein